MPPNLSRNNNPISFINHTYQKHPFSHQEEILQQI